MKMKFCSLIVGASLFALSSTAHAGQPLALSDNQMDGVTAGASATADAGGMAMGDLMTLSFAQTATDAVTNITGVQVGIAFAGAFSETAAASALFQAAVVSHSDSAASLP